jgi:hypothetical protein
MRLRFTRAATALVGTFALLAALAFSTPRATAYGPNGHQLVGAIADERLADTPTGRRLRGILQGFTLQKASVIPDEIKGWDKKGVDDPGIFRYSSRPRVDAELADFWRANQPTYDMASEAPNHHWFHYTDVPIEGGQRYADGKVGRSRWDIVQTMNYCVRVLEGTEPEDNPRKITKSIAVILLAHLVGDIHQPLHVGAQYFDEQGRPVDPEKTQPAYDHHGGNTITLQFTPAAAERTGVKKAKFHGFWDNQVVAMSLPFIAKGTPKEERRAITDEARRKLVAEWVATEPKAWRTPANLQPTQYAEAWANEILPLAVEAHARLDFRNVRPQVDEKGRTLAVGIAHEKPMADGVPYHDWAAAVTRENLHKAGWRLADLLEKSLK